MTVIDARGNLHDGAGLFETKTGPAAGFDLAPAAVQVVPDTLFTAANQDVTSYGDYVSEHTTRWLTRHVNAGRLPAPVLTAPDPRPYLDGYAAANDLSFAQRAALYQDAQLTMRASAGGLRDGDQIVATPLVTNHYGPTCDECLARLTVTESGLVHTDGEWCDPDVDPAHPAEDSLYTDLLDSSRADFFTVTDIEVAIGADGRPWTTVDTSMGRFYDVPAAQQIDFVPNLATRCHECGGSVVSDPSDGDDPHLCGTCEQDHRDRGSRR